MVKVPIQFLFILFMAALLQGCPEAPVADAPQSGRATTTLATSQPTNNDGTNFEFEEFEETSSSSTNASGTDKGLLSASVVIPDIIAKGSNKAITISGTGFEENSMRITEEVKPASKC